MNSTLIREDCRNLLTNFGNFEALFDKRFLVTGSNGLIGNYIVNLLSTANEYYNANIMAHCVSKNPPVWKDDRFNYITHDLSQPFSFSHPVDFVIHSACYSGPKMFLGDELKTISLNVNATKDLLDISKANNAKFLLLSTSEVYGNPPPNEIPTKESYPGNSLTSSGRASYIESKKVGEALCFIYNRKFGVDAKIARVALVYGPGLSIHDERAMGNFMKKAFIDKHIKLMDEGKDLRSYCYISDALFMMFKIMLEGKELLYNVGATETVSIYEMAQLIAEVYGATCEAGTGKMMKDAPGIVKLDVSKVCNEFKIKQFISFKDGLQRTIEWNLNQGAINE